MYQRESLVNLLTPRVQQVRQAIIKEVLSRPGSYFDAMQAHLDRHNLHILPPVPQPYILPKAARPYLQAIGEQIAHAFEHVCQQAYKEGLDRHTPHLHPRSKALLTEHFEPDPPFMHCARFDGLLDEETGTFSLLECNAGDPSGDGLNDAMLDGMLDAGILDCIGPSGSYQYDRLLDSHHHMTTQHLNTSNLPPDARWVRLSDPEAFVHCDHQYFAKRYTELGRPLELVDPRACSYDGHTLTHDGQPIDVILRDTIDELILPPHWPDAQAILDAYTNGHVQMLNPLKTILGDDKSLLEMLSFAENDTTLPPDIRHTIAQCMPWTRLVRDRHTTHQAQDIDLLPFLQSNRETLVLKPVEGYGGFGITIGPEASQAQWDQAIANAMIQPGSTIAQTYRTIPQAPFVFQQPDGSFAAQPKKITLSFWIHNMQFAGCYVRISDDTIINVHQGGALLPVIYV
jgi:hypothetical protein